MIAILYVIVNIVLADGKKIFTFDGSRHQNLKDHSPSFATLMNSPAEQLPSKFIICSSHQQGSVNNRGFYQLLGEDGQPWWGSVWWQSSGSGTVELSAYVDKDWISLGFIQDPKLFYWYVTCVDIDTEQETVSAAVNGIKIGQDIVIKDKGLNKNKPDMLRNNILIGKWQEQNKIFQFIASVSNINIYKSQSNLDIEMLSREPCITPGTYFSWEQMSWNLSGSSIQEKEMEDDFVCNQSETFNLAISFSISQRSASLLCEKLGHGQMTAASSEEDLAKFIDWFEDTTSTHNCPKIWTPFSDLEEEGMFRNIHDGSKPNYLPWVPGQPDGGKGQNAVAIHKGTQYKDVSEFLTYCYSCTMKKSVTLTLRNICGTSLLG